ncbi:MAG: tetratricopeptide repeat protein [Desulfovibrionaceae bacterium]
MRTTGRLARPSFLFLWLWLALLPLGLVDCAATGHGRGAPEGYARGLDLAHAGQHEAALAQYDAALAQNPAFAPAWLARAESRLALEQVKPGLDDLDHALTLAPDDARALGLRAGLLRTLSRWDAAARDYARLGTLEPAVEEWPLGEGFCRSQSGDWPGAAAAYARAAALAPDDPWAQGGLAANLALDSRCTEALAPFDRVVALAPDSPAAHMGRGVCLASLGRTADAEADFSRVLELAPPQDPQYAEALFQRAEARAALGRTADAAHDYAAILALDPERTAAARGEMLEPRRLAELLRKAVTAQGAAAGGMLPLLRCFAAHQLDKALPGCRQLLDNPR